jgi:hypothetical protein
MADYGINIGVNVQSQSLTRLTNQLKELIATEKKIKGELKETGANTEKLNKQLEKNTQRQKVNKKAALDSAKAFTTGSEQVRKSSAALAEQSKQLDAYRRGVKFGSGAWADFTRAIVKTDFTSSIIQLRRLNKEAETTAAAFRDMAAGGGRSGAQFAKGQSIQDLLAFKPANTTNALRTYSETLQGVIGQVDRGTAEYRELFAAIRKVNEELARTPGVATSQYTAPIGPEPARTGFAASAIQGGRRIAGSPIARRLRNRRVNNAIGGGLLGGGFPVMMGQSAPAAVLGGIGGAAGGALGGQFGFALGILGTAIGEAIDKNIRFHKSLGDLNNAFAKAGSDAKFFAGDIDELAQSLRITKEEAMQLAASFAFLGDKELGVNAAKLFGTPQLLRSVAQIKDAASLGEALRDLSGEIGEQEAKALGTEIRGLSIKEQRLKIEEKLNQVRGKTVKLTNEEIRAMGGSAGRRVFRGAAPRPTRFKTAIPASELGVSESSAEFEEFLRSFEDQPTGGGRVKADPTIMLRRRLEVVQAQVTAETNLIELQGKQTQAGRIILQQETAIAKAKATAKAELEKFKDPEDQRLVRLRETGEIAVANLKFDRQALELAEKTLAQTENLVKPLDDQLNAIKDKAAFEREYGELIMAGVVPAVAQQTVEINQQVKELDRLTKKQLTEIDLRIETLQLLVDAAAGTELQAELQERLNKALERRNEIERRGEEAKGAARDAAKTDRDRLDDAIKVIQSQINTLMDPVNQLIALSDSLGNSFAESFKGIVTGSMSAREALANLFQRTADHFLDMAAQMIAAQIKMQILKIGLNFFGGGNYSMSGGGMPFGGSGAAPAGLNTSFIGSPLFGQRAIGGPVSGNRPYLVGERGPELFVPGAQGNIVPNNAMGSANVTVNVDASGSSVEGDSEQAGQLGKMLGAAVQAELIKQKRPGGLLA